MRHVLLLTLCATALYGQQRPTPPHYGDLDGLRRSGSLTVGSHGADVAALQWALAFLGYEVAADGEFGNQTRAALEGFQAAVGLDPDGVAGARTVIALDERFAEPLPAGSESHLAKQLKSALQAGERGAAFALIAALGAHDSAKAVDAISKRWERLLEEEPGYRVCRQVLRGLRADEARARVVRLLARGAPLEQLLAIEVLEAWDREEDDAALIEALDERAGPVRRRAILALGKRRRVPVVYALIAHMKARDRERDGEHQQVAAALDKLVGQRLGLGKDYEGWFDGDLDNLGAPPPRAGVDTTVTYYDASLVSPALVFLFDTSCSMRSRGYLEPAKAELARTLSSLPEGTRFNVLSFATEARLWQPRLVPASRRSLEAAVAHVGGLEVEGDRTRLDRALFRALAMEGVDTVVILTDGYPEKSQPIPDSVMLDLLEEHNRLRQVRVVTFGFAQANLPLLEAFAASTGGESQVLDE